MKASHYNLFVDHPETGEVIIYNSLYGSLTIWEPSEFEVVTQLLGRPDHAAYEDLSIFQVLVEQKHIVEDTVDEFSIIKTRKRMGVEDPNRLDVVIMPTLNCNFACPYCFETARPSKMDDETEQSIRQWLAIQVPQYKFVLLHWFGGEPLLEPKRILSISKQLAAVASSAGTAFAVHVTTNGYHFSKRMVRDLTAAGIFDYQITVDGPPETHNTLRVLKSGKGTFERIYGNINAAVRTDRRIKITLRVNFNHSNIHSIPRLLDMFPADVRPNLRVIYEPIFGTCAHSAVDNIPTKDISEALSAYYELARQMGYDVVLCGGGINTGKLVYCYAEREHQVIINYNGDVFKCSVSNFNPEDRLGYLDSEGVLVKEPERWKNWVNVDDLFSDACVSCIYLPLCMGGCRKTRLLNKGQGSYCTLIPTNASYVLKQIALSGFNELLLRGAAS